MIKDVYEEKNTRYYKKNLPPPIVKHEDGSIIVWACFSADGVGNMHKIGGIIHLREYARILDKNLACSAKKLKLKNYIFQQDNGSKHTSKYVSKYLID